MGLGFAVEELRKLFSSVLRHAVELPIAVQLVTGQGLRIESSLSTEC